MTQLQDPPAPEAEPTDHLTTGDAPPKRRRRPRRALLLAAGTGLLVGLGVGAASADQQDELDRSAAALRTTRATLADTRTDLARTREELSGARTTQAGLSEDLDAAEARIEKLTAEATVPSFIGDDLADVREDDLVGELDWRVETVRRPSDRAVGTVLAQTPAEGRDLGRGRTLRLEVAARRPKTWRTIASFSGAGERRTDEFTIPEDVKVRVKYSFAGDTNAILELRSPGDGSFGGDLLLNEIGDYADTTRLYDAAGERYLEIQGGTWNVEVQAYR